MRKVLFGLIVLASVGVAGWMIVLDRQNRLHCDHWDVVKPGILYRSGQLTSTQLTEAVRRYGIRTVVNFQLPGREMEAERTLAGKLGIGFVNLPMPGDGFGEEAQFRKVLEVIDDPERQPVLVHCTRGPAAPVRLWLCTGSAQRLDDPGRRGRNKAADLSRWVHSRLHLCHGQDQAFAGVAPPVTINDRNGTTTDSRSGSRSKPRPGEEVANAP